MSWLKAVSFRLSLAPSQLLNDKVELVQAGLNKPAYGRPEENSMTLLSVQPESNARPVLGTGQSFQPGPVDGGKADSCRWSSSEGAWVLLKSN